MPVNSTVDPDANEGADGTGLAFAEMQEWVKTAPFYRCGRKGHLLSNYKKTPPWRKKFIYAMVNIALYMRSEERRVSAIWYVCICCIV